MLADRTSGVKTVHSFAELFSLDCIGDEDVDIVICARKIPGNVQAWLDGLPARHMPEGRFALKPGDVARCIFQLFAKHGHAPMDALRWLAEDVQAMAGQLCQTFSNSHLRLRVETVTHNACRKFHIDNVQARLICTYSGPGTEYGMNENASLPQHIQQVPTGQPALFKGLLWSTAERRRVRHRSPPIEGTGLARLVVILDTISLDTKDNNPYDKPFG